jgi:hypothetical protein
MAVKLCKHCAMEIPEAAKICPHCRKHLNYVPTGTVVLVFAGLVFFIYIISSISGCPGSEDKPQYTQKQIDAAKNYQSKMIKNGLVTDVKRDGELHIFYINRLEWNTLRYETKKKILKAISGTNEQQCMTPFVNLLDDHTGEKLAAVEPPLTVEVYK